MVMEAASATDSSSSTKQSFTKFTFHETSSFCRDWTRPHYSLMEIISSSIIAYVGRRFGLEYKHSCHSTVAHKDSETSLKGFDVTTIQQIFPRATMPVNERLIKIRDVVHKLYRNCISEYEKVLLRSDNF